MFNPQAHGKEVPKKLLEKQRLPEIMQMDPIMSATRGSFENSGLVSCLMTKPKVQHSHKIFMWTIQTDAKNIDMKKKF